MFINYTKKFIFLAVTKTGSTSIQTSLIDNRGLDDVAYTSIEYGDLIPQLNMPEGASSHLTLDAALNLNVLTRSQIEEFKIFGVLRSPIDRFISLAYFTLPPEQAQVWGQNIAVREWFKRRDSMRKSQTDETNIDKELTKPQTHWLTFENKPISNIVLYEDVDNIMFEMTGTHVELPNHRSMHRTDRSDYNKLYDNLKKDIINAYRDDFELYEKLRGSRRM